MADEKRDAETDLLLDIQKIIGADKPYEAVEIARYVEFREAEIRRQIGDELLSIANEARNDAQEWSVNIRDYIEKLRGKQ